MVPITAQGSTPKPSRTRHELASDLLELLRLSQLDWTRASEEDRDAARQRFMEALDAFNRVVLQGRLFL